MYSVNVGAESVTLCTGEWSKALDVVAVESSAPALVFEPITYNTTYNTTIAYYIHVFHLKMFT